MKLPILLLFFLGLSLSANAEIYKWVDENGKVHFSDTPPVGQQSEQKEYHYNKKYRGPVKVPKSTINSYSSNKKNAKTKSKSKSVQPPVQTYEQMVKQGMGDAARCKTLKRKIRAVRKKANKAQRAGEHTRYFQYEQKISRYQQEMTKVCR